MPENDPPKIHVDSDWKQQAQAEKERLAAKEQAAARPKAAAGAQGGDAAGDEHAPPAADFQALVGTILTPALHYLGAFPDPETGRAVISLDYARLYIDLLGVLEEKTRGNLTPDESRDLTQALSELRMRFVEISKAVATHLAKERAAGAGGMGGVGGMGGLGGGGMGGGISGPDLRITP